VTKYQGIEKKKYLSEKLMKHVLRYLISASPLSQGYFYPGIFRSALGNPASINRYQQARVKILVPLVGCRYLSLCSLSGMLEGVSQASRYRNWNLHAGGCY
jgi:hypothetical protein